MRRKELHVLAAYKSRSRHAFGKVGYFQHASFDLAGARHESMHWHG